MLRFAADHWRRQPARYCRNNVFLRSKEVLFDHASHYWLGHRIARLVFAVEKKATDFDCHYLHDLGAFFWLGSLSVHHLFLIA